jgi:hypothetical protein
MTCWRTAVAALCLLSACDEDPTRKSNQAPEGPPNQAPEGPDTHERPCLAALATRVEALQDSVDALELAAGPTGARGARGEVGPEGPAGPAGRDADLAAHARLVAKLDVLDDELEAVEDSLDAAEAQVLQQAERPHQLLNAMGMLAVAPPAPATCTGVMNKLPNAPSAEYTLDADGAGPGQAILTYCDFTVDGGGYGWVRIDDASLARDQAAYAAKCREYGMEIVVPRTKAHALAMKRQLGEPPNLVNVFPRSSGATTLDNFTGSCAGQPCSFWLSATTNSDCQGTEPNGDNTTADRLYRFGPANVCDYGRWNDFRNNVDITGWVICSPNDK